MKSRIERRLAEPRRVLSKALQASDEDLIAEAADQIEYAALGYARMPEPAFALLVSAVLSPRGRRNPGIWRLLLKFHYDWDQLTVRQKRRLLAILKQNYPKFRVWMAWFTTSSLLGEDFCNAAALKVIEELSTVSSSHARSFIPHALEHIVTDSESPRLATRAFRLLSKMAGDRAEAVRGEVALSLARIEARGSRRAV